MSPIEEVPLVDQALDCCHRSTGFGECQAMRIATAEAINPVEIPANLADQCQEFVEDSLDPRYRRRPAEQSSEAPQVSPNDVLAREHLGAVRLLDPIDEDRFSKSLQREGIDERRTNFGLIDRKPGGRRHVDLIGGRNAFDPGGERHRVAKEVTFLTQHVA